MCHGYLTMFQLTPRPLNELSTMANISIAFWVWGAEIRQECLVTVG